MSLLHATWLPLQRSQSSMDSPALFLWADKWRVAKPIAFSNKPQKHPFTLSNEDLCTWLTTKNLLPKEFKNIYAYLNLPSKEIKSGLKSQPIYTKATNHNNLNAQLTYLPLQAEEPIPKTYLWWP